MSIIVQKERIATQCVCCGSRELQASPAVLMPFVAERAFGWRPVVIDSSWGLRTIPNGQAYSVCNSLYCVQCNFIFLDIRFSDFEMSRLYDDYRGEAYTSLRDKYEPGYALRNEELNKAIPYLEEVESFINPYVSLSPAVLDWGGDTGKNTPFRDKNSILHVHDISLKPVIPGACSVTKEETLKWDYDLVVCSEVLEHIPYPSEMLLEIRDRMHEQTVLYLEVPHEPLISSGMDNPALHKKHWHEHINFFSVEALKRLLGLCGFSVVDIRSSSIFLGGAEVEILQVIAQKI